MLHSGNFLENFTENRHKETRMAKILLQLLEYFLYYFSVKINFYTEIVWKPFMSKITF